MYVCVCVCCVLDAAVEISVDRNNQSNFLRQEVCVKALHLLECLFHEARNDGEWVGVYAQGWGFGSEGYILTQFTSFL